MRDFELDCGSSPTQNQISTLNAVQKQYELADIGINTALTKSLPFHQFVG
jgi:hypothetical protein